MCGRTACALAPQEILKACSFKDRGGHSQQPAWVNAPGGHKYIGGYNLAPGAHTPVLLSAGHLRQSLRHVRVNAQVWGCQRVVMPMKWGLTPPWHQGDPYKVPYETNNCRAEGMLEKKTYKVPLQQGNRCVILAEGFFEWKSSKEGKQPYYFYFPQPPAESSYSDCASMTSLHSPVKKEKETVLGQSLQSGIAVRSAMGTDNSSSQNMTVKEELPVKSEYDVHNTSASFKGSKDLSTDGETLEATCKHLNDIDSSEIQNTCTTLPLVKEKVKGEILNLSNTKDDKPVVKTCQRLIKSDPMKKEILGDTAHESVKTEPTEDILSNKESMARTCLERASQCLKHGRKVCSLESVRSSAEAGESVTAQSQPKLLTIAGVFDKWQTPQGEDPLFSYSIITVSSSSDMDWCHHRMPAILSGDEEVEMWLESSIVPLKQAVSVIGPKVCLSHHAVSKAVNNSRYESPDCVKPVLHSRSSTVPQNPASQLMARWLQSASPPKRKLQESSEGINLEHSVGKIPRTALPPQKKEEGKQRKNIMMNWLMSSKKT